MTIVLPVQVGTISQKGGVFSNMKNRSVNLWKPTRKPDHAQVINKKNPSWINAKRRNPQIQSRVNKPEEPE